MLYTIHKYLFPIADTFELILPLGAKILSVDCQRGFPAMWILHDTDKKIIETRHFRLYGTGHDIKDIDDLIFVASFQMHNGDFVWHLFEEKNAGTTYIEDIFKKKTEPLPTE